MTNDARGSYFLTNNKSNDDARFKFQVKNHITL